MLSFIKIISFLTGDSCRNYYLSRNKIDIQIDIEYELQHLNKIYDGNVIFSDSLRKILNIQRKTSLCILNNSPVTTVNYNRQLGEERIPLRTDTRAMS